MSDQDRLATQRLGATGSFAVSPGNTLFEAAVRAIDVDTAVARLVLVAAMNTIGVPPEGLTPDDLGALLPEIERRVRQLAPGEKVDAASKALTQLLLGWDDGA